MFSCINLVKICATWNSFNSPPPNNETYNGRQKWLRQLTESSANCNISLIPFLISFTSRATPPSPFSMLHRKEASSRDRKSNIVLGEGGCIVELRGEMSLKYTKRAKCLNTFGAHCLNEKNWNFMETRHCVTWIPTQVILIGNMITLVLVSVTWN